MATPFYLYGSSPDALAAQQQNYERLFTSAAEGNRGAAMDAGRFNIQAQIQAQQADEQARQLDAQRRMQAFAIQSRDAEMAAARGEEMRRFNLGQSIAEQERKRAINFQTKFQEPEALEALEGRRLTNKLLKARPDMEANQRLAGVMEYFSVPRPRDSVDVNAFSKAYQVPAAEITPFVEKADSEFAAQQAGQLNAELNARKSAWEKAVTAATKVATEAPPDIIARIKSSVEAEQGKIHPKVKFDQASGFWKVGETQPAPAPASPTSYVPGKRYGNLRYLGGDPNVESSWKPVTEATSVAGLPGITPEIQDRVRGNVASGMAARLGL